MRRSKQWAHSRTAWDPQCPWGDTQAGEPASGHLPAGSPRCLPELGARTLHCRLMHPSGSRAGGRTLLSRGRDDLIC